MPLHAAEGAEEEGTACRSTPQKAQKAQKKAQHAAAYAAKGAAAEACPFVFLPVRPYPCFGLKNARFVF
jgi:hypothetical protein